MGRSYKRAAHALNQIAANHPDFEGMTPKQVLLTLIAAAKNDPSAVAHVESARINARRMARWEGICRRLRRRFPVLARRPVGEVFALVVRSLQGDQVAIRTMKKATGGVFPSDGNSAG